MIYSALRQPQAQRTADKPWQTQSAQALTAFTKLCRTALACEAEAQQALSACEQDVQVTQCAQPPMRPLARDGKRGRPSPGASPEQIVSQVEGALASSLAARQARLTPQSCFILATNALDDQRLSPPERLDGYKGQSQAERGGRFLKAPQFLASSLSRKKPARIMALLMIRTVCLLVYAALEYRIRPALKDHGATFPDQQGTPTQLPTARWVFHAFGGMPLLSVSGQWPLGLNLTEEHCNLLKLLGKPYMQRYGVKYS